MKLSRIVDDVMHAIQNPFGLNFVTFEDRVYIPLGSAMNCLGYNDYLEKPIGIARFAMGLFAMVNGQTNQEKALGAAHVFRAGMEMMGNCEKYLLIIDTAVTFYNIVKPYTTESKDNAAPNPVSEVGC